MRDIYCLEPHKVDAWLWQQVQHHQDTTGDVNIWKETQDVVLCDDTFGLWGGAQHGGGTVWHPESKVQLQETKEKKPVSNLILQEAKETKWTASYQVYCCLTRLLFHLSN